MVFMFAGTGVAAEVLTPRFARQVLSGRWFTLFACLLILSVSGATYAFGICSQSLKTTLNYDQRAIDTLAFFKDLGSYVGIPAGLLLEVAPPSVVLAVGAAMNLAGYLMVYLSLTSRVTRPPLWLMCVYVAAVYLAVYGGGDARELVLLIAWLPAAVSVVFLATVRVRRRSASPGGGGGGGGGDVFNCLLYISMALAAYILVMIVVQRQVVISHAGYAASATGLLLLLFLPLAVVVREEYQIKKDLDEDYQQVAPTTVITVVEKTSTLPMSIMSDELPASVDNTPPPSPPSSSSSSSALIITFLKHTVWNYAGRVTAGYLSEALLTSRYKLPRPLALTAVLVVSCSGHLLVAAGAPRGTLYAASVIVGFCSGAQVPVLYAVISELFGLKRYPTLYNLGAIASPVGSYVLNVRVAGRMYDAEAARQHGGGGGGGGGGEKMCVGVECFRRSFLIVTAATVAGAVVSLVLVWRTREFYMGDIYAKFRDDDVSEAIALEESLPRQRQGDGRRPVNGGERNGNG
ncbi:hypothetical protein HU200_052416 [Digitaria exilis]|uniref:Nodulin-like domain-containing protein n=1 Tax=Digitaria exilis TaxID=1010633 RepID=A0A835E486_9POAL|nr:hypothetical protein HU200_052416 [Digitaria exilis]